jgi:cobalt-zinc-cadmium efflux system membrane fusion protein
LEAETSRTESEIAVRKAVQTLVNLGLSITFTEACETSPAELRRKVQFLGLPLHLVENLDPAQTTSNLMPIVAPRDGIVETRDVVAGEFVDTAKTLFTVVDPSRMWLTMNVPIEDIRHVSLGQDVIFQPDGQTRHQGTVTWMSTAVDMDTRTVQVRAELPNEDGHLRDETFGTGQIVLRKEKDAVLIPNEAVHWEGCCFVAFVRDKDYMEKDSYKVFHTRMIRPGVTNGDFTEMIAGVLPGEVVATKGSGILRAELLKGNLGAG